MQRKQRKRNEVEKFGIYEDIKNMSRKASGSLAHVSEDSKSSIRPYKFTAPAAHPSGWFPTDFEHVTYYVDHFTAVHGGTFNYPHCCSTHVPHNFVPVSDRLVLVHVSMTNAAGLNRIFLLPVMLF
jgi:hypothetical protein